MFQILGSASAVAVQKFGRAESWDIALEGFML